MNAQQLYDEALRHLNGTDNYAKNPKKGKKLMLEASKLGNAQADGYCAMNFAKSDAEKIAYFKKNGAGANYPTEYLRCLLATAKKPDLIKNNYEVAKTLKLEGDGYYYFAELSKLAGESDKVYRDNLYLASLALSKAMPEKAYKYIGRDYGVYYDKEEIELWAKAYNVKAYYGKIEKTEEEAWRIVESNLSTKEGKAKLPTGGAAAILRKKPTATLEYQRVLYACYRTEVIDAAIEYNNPNYSSVMKGTVSNFNVNEDNPTRAHWFPDFRFHATHKLAWQTFKSMNYTATAPVKGRFRVGTPYYNAIKNECLAETQKASKDHALWRLKEHYNKTKGWETNYIKTTLQKSDTSFDEFRIYFVPFYYFTAELGLGNTATVRINAQTGEIEYFENCPFGQFDEYDKYLIGGNARMSKDQIKSLAKAKAKSASEKDMKIAKYCAIAGVVAFIFSMITMESMNEVAPFIFIASLGLFAFAIWSAFKSFIISFFGRFKK